MDPISRPEKDAEKLARQTATLLTLYETLSSDDAAQAFLAFAREVKLNAESKDGVKVVSAYTAVFRALAVSGRPWRTHVCDLALCGANATAREAAERGAGAKSVRPKSAMALALASDLRVYESLANVSETTMSAWVRACTKDLSGDFCSAAAALGVDSGSVEDASVGDVAALNVSSDVIHAPATKRDRKIMRDAFDASSSWGERADDLMRFYAKHGAGILGSHSVVSFDAQAAWVARTMDKEDESMYSFSDLGAAWSTPTLRSTERAAEIIRRNTERHGSGIGKAQHILLHGNEGSGKRWLFRSVLGSMIRAGETNVRVVLLSRGELRNLTQLCDRMKNEPRVRFVVLLELPLALAPHAEFYNTLTSALDGGGTIWPDNAVMYATAPCDSCLKPDSHEGGSRGLSDMFGTKIDLHSSPERFVADARDLAQRQGINIDDNTALQFLGESKPSVTLAQSFIDGVVAGTQ
jgi:hypothetical protein